MMISYVLFYCFLYVLFDLKREIIKCVKHKQVRDEKYVGKVLDRFGPAVGQGMATFLSTGNITSSTGLDLMQVTVY